MKRAVIYARFSCSKQSEASIEDQIRVCRAWCAREGYEVVGEYADHAISGRTDERPEFQTMIERAGESDIVLVYMMDRFSRDAYDAPLYKKRLRDHGVRVVSATEAIPDTAEAILMEKIYEGLAAVESAHIAERTRRGMEGRALKCMHNGVRVYGYDYGLDGRYVVNDIEAEVVKEVFRRRISGESINSIAADLARRGVKSYAGNPVNYSFVYNMIRNEKYLGIYKWGSIREEGGMPAIIDEGTFTMAQNIRSKKQRPSEEWGEYSLSGRSICKLCGSNLVGISGRNHSNKKYEYYRCAKRCSNKPIRADELERLVASAVRDLLSDREQALELARAIERYAQSNRSTVAIEGAQKRKKEAERAYDNFMIAVSKGLSFEEVKPRLIACKEQIAACEAEIAMYESSANFDVDRFADFLVWGLKLDDKQLLEAMVWQVIVGEDDIIAVLNFNTKNNEPATLTVERVRTISEWLPLKTRLQTKLAVLVNTDSVLIKFSRAA